MIQGLTAQKSNKYDSTVGFDFLKYAGFINLE